MSTEPEVFIGAEIFDGMCRHINAALMIGDGWVIDILPVSEVPKNIRITRLSGGTLAPGFVDLQVNGGGGIMFNDAPTIATLHQIASAHAQLGTTALLPTLISDSPERTRAAIATSISAVEAQVPGVVGLHLEGPHLSVARKGVHEAAFIRTMTTDDLEALCDAAHALPTLMLTVAPESVDPDQISTLTSAGATVSLGHTDADFETCTAAMAAGAHCTTHLFNAMSQLGSREPGLVGATLSNDRQNAGIIADAIHVHPATIATVLRVKSNEESGAVFLVTDAMSLVGSDQIEFTLNGRHILRQNGRLTLEDGTLAGTDLEMAQALRVMMKQVGCTADTALKMATRCPANVIARPDLGGIQPGAVADFILLDASFTLVNVWKNGVSQTQPIQRTNWC